MNPRRRELLMKVMDGNPNCLPILYHLDQYLRCDQMLSWLIQNRFMGDEFLFWFKWECDSSLLSMGKFLLARIEKNEKTQILYGRDLV